VNTILVVDNEPEINSTLFQVLSAEGFKIHQVTNGREAIDAYRKSPADVVITDMRIQELDGHEVIRQLKQLDEHVAAIMLTDRGDLNDTIGAHLMDGVYHYLFKPLENPKLLIAAANGAIENRHLKLENEALLSRLYTANKEQGKEMPTSATRHLFQDMSDRRQVQEHIRLSKIMLQLVFDGISNPLVMMDRHLIVRMLNRSAKTYYKIKDYKDLIGKTCDALFRNDSTCKQCKIPQAVKSGKALVFERPGFMAEDRVEKVTIYPLARSATGLDGSLIQITDITETKAIQRQIIQNEKLAALGLLVSGVAHEINNPNNFITFNIPILKSYIKAILDQISKGTKESQTNNWFGMSFNDFGNEIFKLIGNLEHGTHRIAEIVDNLRTLVAAETGGKARQPCDVQKIVRHIDALCRSEIQQYVKKFEVRCPDDISMVMSDSAALEQILINLLINAAHAANKPDSKIMLSVAIKNQILKLEVEDNGGGMDDETLKKIFDPFFTTKNSGLGKGLGLSVCHSLINAMHGTLNVKSILNSGTVFSIQLPVRYADESNHPGNPREVVLTGDITALPVQ
jgi:signal transduction histidine kinase/DNA-binding response OmpR family regulator